MAKSGNKVGWHAGHLGWGTAFGGRLPTVSRHYPQEQPLIPAHPDHTSSLIPKWPKHAKHSQKTTKSGSSHRWVQVVRPRPPKHKWVHWDPTGCPIPPGPCLRPAAPPRTHIHARGPPCPQATLVKVGSWKRVGRELWGKGGTGGGHLTRGLPNF